MNYPRHIGIIPDGNRTRAKQHWYPSIIGHKAWFDNARKLMQYICSDTSIEVITLRGASTENIQERSPEELEYLYDIYQMITEDIINLHNNYGVGFKRIWSKIGLPSSLIDFFKHQEKLYPSKNGKYCILAVNYWWNDEIVRGINTFLSNNRDSKEITAEQLSSSMDLWNIPPIELVIRTKGKMAKRLSGFMTRWISYAELYFSEEYFPDFDVQKLQDALIWFDSVIQHRNYGK